MKTQILDLYICYPDSKFMKVCLNLRCASNKVSMLKNPSIIDIKIMRMSVCLHLEEMAFRLRPFGKYFLRKTFPDCNRIVNTDNARSDEEMG